MYKIAALSILLAFAEARFGQEQVPIDAISQVQGGDAGEAATIAGAAISDLLGGANACDKLKRGDEILSKLGTGQDAVKAAIGMVSAEKNVNNFESQTPTVCSDPSLPTSQQLRGITPLIDPDFDGAQKANQLSKKSKNNPLNAAGKSVLQLMKQNGITNLKGEASGGGAAASGDDSSNDATAASADTGNNNSGSNNQNNGNANNANANPNNDNGASQTSSKANLDFGSCVPTMSFEGGRNGRPANEFTFLPIDSKVAEGQSEALNPNIITNRICDQLTNVCDANQAAKDACEDAKTQIEDLGTKNKGTADAWNKALGFAGAKTNPDGGPATPAQVNKVKREFKA